MAAWLCYSREAAARSPSLRHPSEGVTLKGGWGEGLVSKGQHRTAGVCGDAGPLHTPGSFPSPARPMGSSDRTLSLGGGSEAPRRGPRDVVQVVPSPVDVAEGRPRSAAWSGARSRVAVPNTSIRRSGNALAASQGSALYKRKNLSPKHYCPHLI